MSSLIDGRGQTVGTGSGAAVDVAERALWRMMSFYDTPIADLDTAIAHDPGWLLPRVMKAGFLLSLTEPALVAEAAQVMAQAAPLAPQAPARERAHFAATQAVLEGRWHAACHLWDEWLLLHPRDALALQWAALWDFYRGDAVQLRARPARALPQWDRGDPLYPYVLGLHAFGLEECNLYAQAEEAGRHALALDARVPWAVHAVAHVMEMQGRLDDGVAWLRHHQPQWAPSQGEPNGLAGHLWWHLGLFRLEALDTAGVLRLLDNHLSGDALQITLQTLDAAALLWRLHLLDVDVGDRWQALLARLDGDDAHAGYYGFNDLHAVLAFVGAGDLGRADAWVARCAERVMQPESARGANHATAREVGLPIMRGVLAFGRGDDEGCVRSLYAARTQAQRLGGSHAQRDLIDLTLLAAAARCDALRHREAHAIGRALLNERMMARPATPLARHWAERLKGPPAVA
jgi:hypothetical protein